MHEVAEVAFGGPRRTRLWLSEAVEKAIVRFRRDGDPNGAFWKKIKRYAQTGFALYEHGERPPIRAEWDGVYRIGTVDSLFRIIGFYENDDRNDFIAIDAFLKSGQQLNRAERRRIDEVARVKKDGDWAKISTLRYPRLAE